MGHTEDETWAFVTNESEKLRTLTCTTFGF